jgi:thioredoxin reductase
MYNPNPTNRDNGTAPTVAVIGCGPGGMFFLHAVATKRREMEQTQQIESSNCVLPIVTCFESSSSPGGVWKSDRNGGTTNMYEALWTNGPHFAMEFFDHTYDEHFGCALPMYLPRKLVLEYLLARVTKNDNKFFDQVKFNTTVQSVKYDDEMSKFVIQTLDKTGSVSIGHFDKCIWAGGKNSNPYIPKAMADVLSSFEGRIMHSSQTDENFDMDTNGKSVLIVGDNYSAEDLTLQAIKLGVEEITICSRSGNGTACETEAWPGDKVDVLEGFLPTGVTNDGRGVILSMSEYDFDKDKYTETSDTRTLEVVDTIIFCTGYSSNYGMLDASLRPDNESACFSKDDLPKDWKMTSNFLSEEFGDVPVGRIQNHPGLQRTLYRGALISNPSMMFLKEHIDVPLLSLDVQTWLLLAHITENNIPSVNEMNRWNKEQFINEMDNVFQRFNLDMKYKEAFDDMDDDHWTEDKFDERTIELIQEYYRLQFRTLA